MLLLNIEIHVSIHTFGNPKKISYLINKGGNQSQIYNDGWIKKMDGDGLTGIIGLVVRVQPLRCEGTKGADMG